MLVAFSPGSDWQIVDGSSDFNGDGKADILWRNTDGSVAVWSMDGTTVTNASVIYGPLDSAWQIVDGPAGGNTSGGYNGHATGDYNGDGKADLLWRNASTGEVAIWTMDGTNAPGMEVVGTVSNAWQIVNGNSDFNADGKSDILWHNTDGSVAVWTMNGTTLTDYAVHGPVDNAWGIVTV